MTLTGRLLAFALAGLAVLLAGSSVAVHVLAARHLGRRTGERLDAALDTLAAACEVSPHGVEWEPGERPLRVGPAGGDLLWRVDAPSTLLAGTDPPPPRVATTDWRVQYRFVTGAPGDAAGPPPAGEVWHKGLTLTAGLPLAPTRADLRALDHALGGVSTAALVAAALGGRAVCRRALAPLRRMAADAAGIGPADLSARLTVPPAADELRALGTAFNGLLDRMREAFERQRRFTGDAAHQLRTPLAGVLAQAEVALRRERPAAELRAALAVARDRAAQLTRVVDALLFLARADADAASPPAETFDLATWLADRLADRPGVRVVRPAGPVPVSAPPLLLAELLDVLTDNAVRYGPPGEPVEVRLTAGDRLAMAVSNGGPGLAPADLPRVFEPFARGPGAAAVNPGGVGLGLTIARRLAAALGGELTAASRPGATTFTVWLPPAAGPTRAAPPPAAGC